MRTMRSASWAISSLWVIITIVYINQVIGALGLKEKLNSLPSQLSGGQQQRVAIARALATKPAILLADEPTGNLDSRTSNDVLSLMKVTGQKFSQTMVMITHNETIRIYITWEQAEQLRADPLVKEGGARLFLGMPEEEPFNKSHVEVSYMEPQLASHYFCVPVEGSLPREGTDEAATDTRVLGLLGVEPKVGEQFTVTYNLGVGTGNPKQVTQTFTLSGWWERDEAIVASHVLIPESRVDAVLDEVGVTPPGSNGMIGTWNLDVMLKSGSRHIEQDLNQILADHGYQNETAGDDYIDTGVNWGYTGAQLSDNPKK